MTITNLIPGRRERKPKSQPKHRAADKVAELRDENQRLLARQMAADDFFAILKHDVDTTNAAWQQEKERREVAEWELAQAEAVIRLRDREIADLERKVDVGVKAEHVIAKTQPIPVITPVMPLHKSPLASADPAHVPVMPHAQ